MGDKLEDWAVAQLSSIREAFETHPVAIVAAILLAVLVGYRVGRWYSSREISGMRAENSALKTELRTAGLATSDSSKLVREQVTGMFTADGISESVMISHGALSLAGDFKARVQVQRNSANGWGNTETYHGPAEKTLEDALPHQYRLKCDQFVSGKVLYSLSGIAK